MSFVDRLLDLIVRLDRALLLLDDVQRRLERQRQRIGHTLDRLSRHHAVVDGVLERPLGTAHLLHRIGDQAR